MRLLRITREGAKSLTANKLRTFFSLERISEDEPVAREVIAALTDKTPAHRETYLRELQEKLNEAMQKLSIKQRMVVTLFEIDGLSHQEIAEILNCCFTFRFSPDFNKGIRLQTTVVTRLFDCQIMRNVK